MFAARHYVRIGKQRLAPGELLPEGVDKEKLERLLRLGAIERLAGGGVSAAIGMGTDGATRITATAAPAELVTLTGPGGDPAAEEEEEIDTESEPEEIDALAGIVEEPAESEPESEAKPKPRGRGKGGKGK